MTNHPTPIPIRAPRLLTAAEGHALAVELAQLRAAMQHNAAMAGAVSRAREDEARWRRAGEEGR